MVMARHGAVCDHGLLGGPVPGRADGDLKRILFSLGWPLNEYRDRIPELQHHRGEAGRLRMVRGRKLGDYEGYKIEDN
jgi:hypothetical protein